MIKAKVDLEIAFFWIQWNESMASFEKPERTRPSCSTKTVSAALMDFHEISVLKNGSTSSKSRIQGCSIEDIQRKVIIICQYVGLNLCPNLGNK